MKTSLFPIPKSKKPKLERLRDAYTNACGLGPDNFRRRRRDIREKARARLERYEREEIAKAGGKLTINGETPCEPQLPI